MENTKKFEIEFHFPTRVLKEKDFSPVEVCILNEYYRNEFIDLIKKVSIKYK